jgi:hypothetical protein
MATAAVDLHSHNNHTPYKGTHTHIHGIQAEGGKGGNGEQTVVQRARGLGGGLGAPDNPPV